eukprot:2593890-Pyramimonas_sp.AAC.1
MGHRCLAPWGARAMTGGADDGAALALVPHLNTWAGRAPQLFQQLPDLFWLLPPTPLSCRFTCPVAQASCMLPSRSPRRMLSLLRWLPAS